MIMKRLVIAAAALSVAAAVLADPVVPLRLEQTLPLPDLTVNPIPPGVIRPLAPYRGDLDDALPVVTVDTRGAEVKLDVLVGQTRVDPVTVTEGVGLLVDIEPSLTGPGGVFLPRPSTDTRPAVSSLSYGS